MARPRRADMLFAFDLVRKPVPTFRDHALALLLPLLVALLVLVIGRIEAGQLGALLHFLHQPAFHEFVLGALAGDEIGERGRDHHRAVVVGDDDVVGEDRAAAAADRLVPADEGQLIDRGRRRDARAVSYTHLT